MGFSPWYRVQLDGDSALNCFRQRRMNVDRISDRRGRRAGIHEVDIHVDQLGRVVAQQGRSYDLAVGFIREHFDKSLRLAEFTGFAIALQFETLDTEMAALCFSVSFG